MPIPKNKDALLAIWFLTIVMSLPPVWHYFFQTDFFLKNSRGLQNFAVSAPILLIMLVYAVLLTLPKTRTLNMTCSAGGALLSMGLLMEYYDIFYQTGGWLVMLMGGHLLMDAYRRTKHEKACEQVADKAKTAKTYFSKSTYALIAIWVWTISVCLPPAWHYLFLTDYFIVNFRGLQNLAVSAPILLIMLCYAALLTIPKTRTRNMVVSAGGAFLTMGLLMHYYEMFHQTAGLLVMMGGGGLLNLYRFEEFEVDDEGNSTAPTDSDSVPRADHQRTTEKGQLNIKLID